jgi:neutral ceramidase
MSKATKSAGAAAVAVSETILVGSACVAVNPPLGVALVGYPSPRPNTGVGLDLCARAMAFFHEGEAVPRAAMVVVDNLGATAPVVARIRQKAAELVKGLAPSSILVAATHTHSAPLLKSWTKGGKVMVAADEKYVQQLVDGAAAAIAAASKAPRAVKVRVGRTQAYLGHNRRVLDENGTAHADWLDPEGKHTGYFNPQVPFVVFEDAATGKPAAMVVSYWCHPVTLGPPNTLASADYPGYFVRKLEKETGCATVIHVTGGGANINPRQALLGEPTESQRMGHELAGKVLAALASAQPCPAGPVRIATVPLKLLMAAEAAANDTDRGEVTPKGKVLTTEVQALALGDLVFVTAPGELFAEIGAAMQEASPFAQTLVIGYGDDYLGYLFTDQAKKEGGYEPSHPISEEIEKPLLAAAKKAMKSAKAKKK